MLILTLTVQGILASGVGLSQNIIFSFKTIRFFSSFLRANDLTFSLAKFQIRFLLHVSTPWRIYIMFTECVPRFQGIQSNCI